MRKKWVQFFLCLLFSAGIWLIHNLSQSYVSIVSVPIIAESNLDGHAARSTGDATVTAQIRASGFQSAALGRKLRRPKTIEISAQDFQYLGDDLFSVSNTALLKYSSSIFGESAIVESFISDAPKFAFTRVLHKKVPIRRVSSISFSPQYMASSQMKLQPDSVVVYGERERLDNIEYVLTRPIELHDINASVHGKARLELPNRGVRMSVDEVIYSMEVSRYVEVSAEMKIETRNVPAGQELAVLPSSATVVFRCMFPTSANPAKTAKLYIDYKDFAGSINGRCIAGLDNLPSNVLDYTITPQVFDCFVK